MNYNEFYTVLPLECVSEDLLQKHYKCETVSEEPACHKVKMNILQRKNEQQLNQLLIHGFICIS